MSAPLYETMFHFAAQKRINTPQNQKKSFSLPFLTAAPVLIMATPPKVPREELETVSGFIHSVSPIRITTNNTQMFNAVLQTDREEYHDVVVFSASKRPAFLQAAQNGTPMSLSQVRKTLSKLLIDRLFKQFNQYIDHLY